MITKVKQWIKGKWHLCDFPKVNNNYYMFNDSSKHWHCQECDTDWVMKTPYLKGAVWQKDISSFDPYKDDDEEDILK